MAKPAAAIFLGQYGTGMASQYVEAVYNRRLSDGYNLSDRIWRLKTYAERSILDVVFQGIENGMSAVELSKAVEHFLLGRGPAWTTDVKPSVTGRGTVSYNALRLARTEINQAYHNMQKNLALDNPLLIGQKWNLSNSHPTDWPPSEAYMGYAEICEYRAYADHSGLGPGVYPPGEAPPDHPNGLCYLTSVWKPVEEILDLLSDLESDQMGEELLTDTEDAFVDVGSEDAGSTASRQYQREFRGHLPRMSVEERIATIQEDFKKVGKDLDREEAVRYFDAIRYYTKDGYEDIRRAQLAELKEGKPIEDAHLKEQIALLEEYIASAPLFPEDVPLYRGFGSRNIANLQAFEDAYVNGELITMSGISSWTSEKEIALDFLSGKDHVAVFELVSNKSGVSIRHLSSLYHEDEVLFGTNATFRIIGKSEVHDIEKGVVPVYIVEEVI